MGKSAVKVEGKLCVEENKRHQTCKHWQAQYVPDDSCSSPHGSNGHTRLDGLARLHKLVFFSRLYLLIIPFDMAPKGTSKAQEDTTDIENKLRKRMIESGEWDRQATLDIAQSSL